jgi:hypothetical protein
LQLQYNVDHLTTVCTGAVRGLLLAAPPEMALASRIFINRCAADARIVTLIVTLIGTLIGTLTAICIALYILLLLMLMLMLLLQLPQL